MPTTTQPVNASPDQHDVAADGSDLEAFSTWATWLGGCDLETEHLQAEQEGRDLSKLRAEFDQLLSVPKPDDNWHPHVGGERDAAWHDRAWVLLDKVQAAPMRTDFPHHEPSDLPGIQLARPAIPDVAAFTEGFDAYVDKLHGGLLGRICGCMLGKPVEGFDLDSIRTLCTATDNWPLTHYIHRPTPEQDAVIRAENPRRLPKPLGRGGGYGNEFDGAIQDDDINYTVLGHFIVDRHDHSFTPLKVAHTWMSQLPMLMTCTAERVAYRNFSNAILPPLSASYRNPCREWIGAQIRGDYFGYANPGDPERAADMAFRDACVSHVKNGIYGEMWVAAMLAAAFTCRTLDEVIDAGLAQIPERCRLRAALDHVRRLHADGASFEQVRDDIRGRWDELDHHDWCHTISNAEITLAGLLWGGDDFGAVVCNSVMCGLDTDCTAATAASVWGVLHGVGAVPGKWAGPLDNRGRSHLQIRPNFKIDELAADMAETARRTGARLDA